MKKVLLTGVAGFIGSTTARFLLDSGVEVVGIDNMNNYYDVRLKEHRVEKLLSSTKGLHFRKLDIEQQEAIEPLFKEHSFDCVINLAARAGVRYSMENPHVYLSTNTLGTLNLLGLAKDHGVNKFVLASTSSLYAGQKMPFKEDLAVNTPLSPYAATKKAAEMLCYSYHKLYGIDVNIVRYFTVYGPAGRPDMSIFRFIKWIDEGTPIVLYGDGEQSRDFTYIDDIAKGTIAAAKNCHGYEVINLGGGNNPSSINYVIGKLEKLLDKKATFVNKPFHVADLTETHADISKAYKALNWKPQTSLEEGLEQSVRWYKENKHLVADMDVM